MQLTKTSDSTISWYGPGLAEVSGRSHFCTYISKTVILVWNTTHQDIIQASFGTEIYCASTAATKRTDNEHPWQMSSFCLSFYHGFFDICDEGRLVLIRRHTLQRLILAVRDLPRPCHERECCAGKSGMLSEQLAWK